MLPGLTRAAGWLNSSGPQTAYLSRSSFATETCRRKLTRRLSTVLFVEGKPQ